MTTALVTVPLGSIQAKFDQAGFSTHAFVTILTGLIMIWRSNDFISHITHEVVFTELDLDTLSAQMLWNNVGTELVEVGNTVRNYAQTNKLVRWTTLPHTLLLEIETELLI